MLSACLFALPVQAIELALPPQAQLTASRAEPLGSLRLPRAPFSNGTLPTDLVEGAIDIRAYRMPLEGSSTLELMAGLRDQLMAAGFKVMFDCETEACGGFDFRYGLEVLAEPDMHVNLGDFRYLSARSPAGQPLALLVSRADQIGFVQLTQIIAPGAAGLTPKPQPLPDQPVAQPVETPETPATGPSPVSDLVSGLEAGFPVVLEDLVFAPGASSLSAGSYGSIAALAGWLIKDPRRKVVLVGHTDASGGLEANLRLSKTRAESVRQALLQVQGVVPDQVGAEGVGPLAPRATNLTEEGRRKNRRVEVIMTSTDLFLP